MEFFMYAIIESGSKQYRVAVGETITVDRLNVAEGTELSLDRVLLVSGDDVKVGAPTVDGATVTAKVVTHSRGDKVTTFKYKPRQRTRVRRGFRSSLTTLEITAING
jgi:large subunit ribosomal protein L21